MKGNRTNKGLDPRFADLHGKVLVYVGANARAAQLVQHADGAVLHGRAGLRAARQCKPSDLIAIDPERYDRHRATKPQQQLPIERPRDYVDEQVAAGARLLLAPSSFPTDRSKGSIEKQLDTGHTFVEAAYEIVPSLPAVVPVVIRSEELQDGRWVEPIRSSGLPIATVFAGYKNPLSTPDQIAGAIEVVQAANLACILRCDASAVGLLAVGAVAGSIGTSSGVRQLWLTPRGGRETDPTSRGIFVPRAVSWMRSDVLTELRIDPEFEYLFGCDCPTCDGGDVRDLALNVESNLHEEHSIAAATGLAYDVLTAQDPVSAWINKCRQAVNTYDILHDCGIVDLAKPEALDSWLSILSSAPVRANSQTPSRR